MRPGAHLVAVVPSLEVTLLTYQRIGQWFRRDGSSFSEAAKQMRDSAQHEVVSLAEGIVKISDTPTKHFLREEVLMTFGDARFEIVQLDKNKTYYLCGCFRTKNRPFCDGSHEKIKNSNP